MSEPSGLDALIGKTMHVKMERIIFTKKQERRALALLMARAALIGGLKPTLATVGQVILGMMPVQPGVKVDPNELIDLAAYIEGGTRSPEPLIRVDEVEALKITGEELHRA